MHSIRGTISAVQEGRFRLTADDGRMVHFILSHKADLEPQDLPQMQAEAVHIRVDYEDGGGLIAAVAREIEVEE